MCLLLAQLYPGSLYYHSYTQKHKNALPVTQTHVLRLYQTKKNHRSLQYILVVSHRRIKQ